MLLIAQDVLISDGPILINGIFNHYPSGIPIEIAEEMLTGVLSSAE